VPALFGAGAELAVTYLNDKAKKFVEPLARELEAPILMPLNAVAPGEMEAVFEKIAAIWGSLDSPSNPSHSRSRIRL
jgi:enoyl-[acyl-carrier protein] reductase I